MLLICLCGAILATMAGCFGGYGRLTGNAISVTHDFESRQVPQSYRYYYYGFSSRPYAVIGLDPKYQLVSSSWREVDPNTDEFGEMVKWTWTDTYYHPGHPRGRDLLDHQGNKIGIWYASVRWAAVKILDDQGRVMIAPDTPWMRGTR
jgi:hypothetical protein